jgi:hypothetical protein
MARDMIHMFASLRIEQIYYIYEEKDITNTSFMPLFLSHITQLIDSRLKPSCSLLVVVATLLYTSLWPWPWDFLVAWTKNNSIENQKY